jgi:transposase
MARTKNDPPESIVKETKRNTRRKFTAEEKIRLVLEGLKGDYSTADLFGPGSGWC